MARTRDRIASLQGSKSFHKKRQVNALDLHPQNRTDWPSWNCFLCIGCGLRGPCTYPPTPLRSCPPWRASCLFSTAALPTNSTTTSCVSGLGSPSPSSRRTACRPGQLASLQETSPQVAPLHILRQGTHVSFKSSWKRGCRNTSEDTGCSSTKTPPRITTSWIASTVLALGHCWRDHVTIMCFQACFASETNGPQLQQ